MHAIGIRREDKNPFESRTPLIPEHVARLGREPGVQLLVQPSPRRIFSDEQYLEAGARLSEDLGDCPVILGIKEIPPERLLPGKAYVFFSHTIKGQPHNMPMLRRLLELGCTLIDYEKITDDRGRRLVFFGQHAGLAGMIDTLWALGQRLEAEGTPSLLSRVRPAHRYTDLAEASAELVELGQELRTGRGLPPGLTPLVVGITGYGNVSRGAQKILGLLGAREVSPEGLASLGPGDGALVKVVFEERHLVQPVEPRSVAFDLQDYYDNPAGYRPVFGDHLPRLHVLVNCIYWDERYPRLVTKERLRQLWAGPEAPRLRVIGDISCDVEGSVEATLRATTPQDPVFVYEVDSGQATTGVQGNGPVIMAVDNLPAELPREASRTFSDALLPFVPALASMDASRPLAGCGLPPPLLRAVIAYNGQLTGDFANLQQFL